MPTLPDQLDPVQAADALATCAGISDRLNHLLYRLDDLRSIATGLIPEKAAAAAREPGEVTTHALAAAQVRAADLSAEILLGMDILSARIANSRPYLAAVLEQAAAAQTGEAA
ncbi:hypothetical protein [Xanthobacter sediminis]